MINKVKLKQGLDIAIHGHAAESIGSAMASDVFSIIPDHFAGITPKIDVKEGQRVKAGEVLFHDKNCADILFTAPVSGEILGVNRGERRKVLSINIKADAKVEYATFETGEVAKLQAVDVTALLLKSGLWSLIKQRPYDVLAHPTQAPKAIFISAFDSAPLAPNYEFILKGKSSEIQAGVNALAKIANVHIGLKAGSKAIDFRMLQNVTFTEFDGAHPAGNVGVQIHHVNAVNKGEVVWTINIQDVAIIGRLFTKGIVDMRKLVALTGPEVREPKYYNYTYGSSIINLVRGNVYHELPLRYISGNVLSGTQIDINEPLSPYTNQISVINDGCDTHELIGWAMPRFNKFSVSRTFFTSILKHLPNFQFQYDARILGGRRAIIMSGEYDKVLPMDIYTEYLIKAMIAGNLDKMEALGAYEIAPEDVALCEFVCTSKLPLQAIVRNALDNMKKELE